MDKTKDAVRYSISDVKASDKANTYVLTVTRNGKAVGSVKVMSGSSKSAYFSDSEK